MDTLPTLPKQKIPTLLKDKETSEITSKPQTRHFVYCVLYKAHLQIIMINYLVANVEMCNCVPGIKLYIQGPKELCFLSRKQCALIILLYSGQAASCTALRH